MNERPDIHYGFQGERTASLERLNALRELREHAVLKHSDAMLALLDQMIENEARLLWGHAAVAGGEVSGDAKGPGNPAPPEARSA